MCPARVPVPYDGGKVRCSECGWEGYPLIREDVKRCCNIMLKRVGGLLCTDPDSKEDVLVETDIYAWCENCGVTIDSLESHHGTFQARWFPYRIPQGQTAFFWTSREAKELYELGVEARDEIEYTDLSG